MTKTGHLSVPLQAYPCRHAPHNPLPPVRPAGLPVLYPRPCRPACALHLPPQACLYSTPTVPSAPAPAGLPVFYPCSAFCPCPRRPDCALPLQCPLPLPPQACLCSTPAVPSAHAPAGLPVVYPCDALIFAVGITGMQKLVMACPQLAKQHDFRAIMELKSIDVIATRLWFDRMVPTRYPANVMSGFEPSAGATFFNLNQLQVLEAGWGGGACWGGMLTKLDGEEGPAGDACLLCPLHVPGGVAADTVCGG